MLLVLYVEKLDGGGGGKKEGKARSVALLELHIFDGWGGRLVQWSAQCAGARIERAAKVNRVLQWDSRPGLIKTVDAWCCLSSLREAAPVSRAATVSRVLQWDSRPGLIKTVDAWCCLSSLREAAPVSRAATVNRVLQWESRPGLIKTVDAWCCLSSLREAAPVSYSCDYQLSHCILSKSLSWTLAFSITFHSFVNCFEFVLSPQGTAPSQDARRVLMVKRLTCLINLLEVLASILKHFKVCRFVGDRKVPELLVLDISLVFFVKCYLFAFLFQNTVDVSEARSADAPR